MVPVKFSRGTLLVGVCAPSLLAFLCPNALSLETFLFFVFFSDTCSSSIEQLTSSTTTSLFYSCLCKSKIYLSRFFTRGRHWHLLGTMWVVSMLVMTWFSYITSLCILDICCSHLSRSSWSFFCWLSNCWLRILSFCSSALIWSFSCVFSEDTSWKLRALSFLRILGFWSYEIKVVSGGKNSWEILAFGK